MGRRATTRNEPSSTTASNTAPIITIIDMALYKPPIQSRLPKITGKSQKTINHHPIYTQNIACEPEPDQSGKDFLKPPSGCLRAKPHNIMVYRFHGHLKEISDQINSICFTLYRSGTHKKNQKISITIPTGALMLANTWREGEERGRITVHL